MDILKKYKLYLIDNSLEFPEWKLCEELLGGLGKIEESKDVYINGKFIYHYDSKNGNFYLSYENIWSFFEDKFNMEDINIKHITTLYIENTYYLKGINIKFWFL